MGPHDQPVEQRPGQLPPRVVPEPSAGGEPLSCRADGLRWICLPQFAALLERVPAEAWCRPAEQDWELVKANPLRRVYRARVAGVGLFLKYYRRRGWRGWFKELAQGSPCRYEFEVGRYASRFGIPTVETLGYACDLSVDDGRCDLLVTRAVPGAYLLSSFWQQLCADDDPRRRRRDIAYLTDLLAEMVAFAHQCGLEHCDMHAGNVLIEPLAPGRYRALLVDLQDARVGRPLSDHAVVRNLAQLNQWFRRRATLTDRLRFLKRYLRWRDQYEDLSPHGRKLGLDYRALVAALDKQASQHARRLWRQRDRKVLGTNRYFARLELEGGWRGHVFLAAKQTRPESPASKLELDVDWWRRVLHDPSAWFEEESLCKRSHSALVARAALPRTGQSLPVIVKRPLGRNWRRRLRGWLAPSRSLRGWIMANRLLNRDVPTARPLAVLERRLGPLVRDSLLITERLPGAQDLEAYLRRQHQRLSGPAWLACKRELAAGLARMLRQLFAAGLVHRDCKAQNLLVRAGRPLRLVWIDMDGLRSARRVRRRDEIRALARLHVSLLEVPGLTRSDRLRLLRCYCARWGAAPDAWRRLWREIEPAATEKLARLGRRRRWKLKHYGRT